MEVELLLPEPTRVLEGGRAGDPVVKEGGGEEEESLCLTAALVGQIEGGARLLSFPWPASLGPEELAMTEPSTAVGLPHPFTFDPFCPVQE